MYTQRLQVQPVAVLLSNLSGAIVGILGLLGSFMGMYEGHYINNTKKKSHLNYIRKVEESREGMFFKNFDLNDIIERVPTFTPKVYEKPEQISEDSSSRSYRVSRLTSEFKPEDIIIIPESKQFLGHPNSDARDLI